MLYVHAGIVNKMFIKLATNLKTSLQQQEKKVIGSFWDQIKWSGMMLKGFIWRFTDRDFPFFHARITHISLLSCGVAFEMQKVLKTHCPQNPNFPLNVAFAAFKALKVFNFSPFLSV